IEVPLVARHQALPDAGRADVAVVQPVEGVHADRVDDAERRHRQVGLRLDRPRLPLGGQHLADPARVAAGDRRRAARRPRRTGNQAVRSDPTGMTEVSAIEVPTGNTYDKYASTNRFEQRMMSGFLAALDSLLDGTRPSRVLEIGVGEGVVMARVRDRFPD